MRRRRNSELRMVFHSVKEFSTSRSKRFMGAYLDIGAQKTCIGKPQAKALYRTMGVKLRLQPSRRSFIFGDGHYESLGTL